MSTSHDSRVVFDAGRYSAYEKARQAGLRNGKLVVYVGMIGTPVVLALALVFFWTLPAGIIDIPVTTGMFVAVIVSDEILMHFMVSPSIRRRWATPPKVTETDFEMGRNAIPLSEFQRIRLFDTALELRWKPGSSKYARYMTLSADELGNSEEFVRVVKGRNAGIEFEDLRRGKSP